MLKNGLMLIFAWTICALAFACGNGGGGGGISDGDADTDGDSGTDGDTDTDVDTDTDSDADTDSDSDADVCADYPWDATITPINMLILLDRSLSMHTSEIGGVTYADIVADSLRGVVQTETETGLVNFGLAVFPSTACPNADESTVDNMCIPANADDTVGGVIDNAPVVAVGEDNFASIDAALTAVGQCGGTPICESLEWSLDYLTGSAFPAALAGQQKFVLLATDGAPNCNSAGDIDSCASSDPEGVPTPLRPEQCLDDVCSYNAALQLAAAGIKVFVVGVGEDVADFTDVMQGIAYYGGVGEDATVPETPVYWYPASDATTLQATLEAITGEAISCMFDLDWSEVPDESGGIMVAKGCDKVNVYGVDEGGTEYSLQYDPQCVADGWRWVGIDVEAEELDTYDITQCTEIELCPGACQNLKDQVWKSVKATFGCEVIPVG